MVKKLKQTLSIAIALVVLIVVSACSETKNDEPTPPTPTPEPTPETPFLGSWCSDDSDDEIIFISFYSDKAICIITNEALLKANKYEDKSECSYVYDAKSSKIYLTVDEDEAPTIINYKVAWLESEGRIFYRVADSNLPTIEDDGKTDDDDDDDDDNPVYNPSNGIVSTGGLIKNKGYRVTVSGSVKSVSKNDVAWFRFGCSPTLEGSRKSATLNLSNSLLFEIDLTGIIDNETYYYQAYVLRNGIEYKGEIKKFKSEKFTYSQNGQTYEMITLKGGPYGDISVMQTEIDFSTDLIVGDEHCIGDYNNNGEITKGEYREFLVSLVDETGLLWRFPTSEEWILLAKGGLDGDDYKYSGSDDIDEVAWYSANSSGYAHRAALKKPNKLGLYDMCGNRAEVINDAQSPKLENELFKHNPEKPTVCKDLPAYIVDMAGVAYGGNWSQSAQDCTINSYAKSGGESTNQLDVSKYTIRLVFSRQP